MHPVPVMNKPQSVMTLMAVSVAIFFIKGRICSWYKQIHTIHFNHWNIQCCWSLLHKWKQASLLLHWNSNGFLFVDYFVSEDRLWCKHFDETYKKVMQIINIANINC
jgi:hypothetical protein